MFVSDICGRVGVGCLAVLYTKYMVYLYRYLYSYDDVISIIDELSEITARTCMEFRIHVVHTWYTRTHTC